MYPPTWNNQITEQDLWNDDAQDTKHQVMKNSDSWEMEIKQPYSCTRTNVEPGRKSEKMELRVQGVYGTWSVQVEYQQKVLHRKRDLQRGSLTYSEKYWSGH